MTQQEIEHGIEHEYRKLNNDWWKWILVAILAILAILVFAERHKLWNC